MKTFKAISLGALLSTLAACGGGSDNTPAVPTPTTPPPQAITLSLSSTTLRTLPGGAAIPVTATSSGTGAIQWKLADGAPGTLSASTGTSVTYTPPAGGIDKTTLVPIVATSGGTSATLTVAVTPDPGPSGLFLMADNANPDKSGDPYQFSYANAIAADLSGNVFVLEHFTYRPRLSALGGLRKIAPDGTVSTLVGNGFPSIWFGQAARPDNAQLFANPINVVLDRAGNFYYGSYHRPPASNGLDGDALLKITPSGTLSVLAGTTTSETLDGTGTAARFNYPDTVGIDYDDVIYVQQTDNVARKVTTAGVVTTIPAIPRSLQADMHGNTYAFDSATKTLIRTSPSGEKTVVAGAPTCNGFKPGPLPGCLPNYVARIIAGGGNSLLLLGDSIVVKVVLPR